MVPSLPCTFGSETTLYVDCLPVVRIRCGSRPATGMLAYYDHLDQGWENYGPLALIETSMHHLLFQLIKSYNKIFAKFPTMPV